MIPMGEGDLHPPPSPLLFPQKHWQALELRVGQCGPCILVLRGQQEDILTGEHICHVQKCLQSVCMHHPEQRGQQPLPCLLCPSLIPIGSSTGPFSSLFADTVQPFEKACLGDVLQGLVLAPPEESIFSTQFPKYLVSWPFCIS